MTEEEKKEFCNKRGFFFIRDFQEYRLRVSKDICVHFKKELIHKKLDLLNPEIELLYLKEIASQLV